MDTKLKRRRLARAIDGLMDAAIDTEMIWGIDDCVLWAVEPIRRVLGYDPAASGRGRYRTARGAARVLGKGGVAGAIRRAARKFKWKVIEPRQARPGDVGVATLTLVENGKPLQVNSMVKCFARGWFVGRASVGWTALPAKHVRLAWCVLP